MAVHGEKKKQKQDYFSQQSILLTITSLHKYQNTSITSFHYFRPDFLFQKLNSKEARNYFFFKYWSSKNMSVCLSIQLSWLLQSEHAHTCIIGAKQTQ